ncbi:MAG: DNA-binding protein HU-beta [Miltoncostaeaceae bacterium]|jgi:DNA-binding protein HU-beta|nr:DNA-binding protein HU-beta [Miltoncostaeaceae bacterium]
MTKRDLAQRIADDGETPQKLAEWAVDAVCGAIASALERGEDVGIAGFGKFAAVERAARQARDPRTGAGIDVPARLVPKFSPASALKESVARAGAAQSA